MFGLISVLSCKKVTFVFLCHLLHDYSENFRMLFENMYFFSSKGVLKGVLKEQAFLLHGLLHSMLSSFVAMVWIF